MRPSLVLASDSDPRTSTSIWYGGMSTQAPGRRLRRRGRGAAGARRRAGAARRPRRTASERLANLLASSRNSMPGTLSRFAEHPQHLPARPALAHQLARRPVQLCQRPSAFT